MPRPCVLNWRIHGNPEGSVCIMRPGKWGNPYRVGPDGTRSQVMTKYRGYLNRSTYLRRHKHEIRGRDLVCCCKPLDCHGDILVEWANE